jgi:hypothetical protein
MNDDTQKLTPWSHCYHPPGAEYAAAWDELAKANVLLEAMRYVPQPKPSWPVRAWRKLRGKWTVLMWRLGR